MSLFTFIAAHKTASYVCGSFVAGAAAAEMAAPAVIATDYTGIAALVGVAGVFIVNIMKERTLKKAQEEKDKRETEDRRSRELREAEDRKELKDELKATRAASEAASAKAAEAKVAMDGGLEKLIKKVEEGGELKGKADEQSAQAGRNQAADDATAVEEERARHLLTRTVAPAAHHAPTTALNVPVPVEVVNPPDQALNVKIGGEE